MTYTAFYPLSDELRRRGVDGPTAIAFERNTIAETMLKAKQDGYRPTGQKPTVAWHPEGVHVFLQVEKVGTNVS